MCVIWLGEWPDQVNAYLEHPTNAAVVESMATYLSMCPVPLSDEHILDIAGQLLVLPNMTDDDADELALLQQPATEEDVALATDDVDPELLHALLADAPQQLDELEQTVSQWAAGTCSEADMQEALRSAHTLKGSGGIIGLPGIARLAHRLEDILLHAAEHLQMNEGVGERPHEALSRDVLQAVHCLQQMVSHLQGNEEAPSNAKPVLQNLLDWVKLIRSGGIENFEPSAHSSAEPAVESSPAQTTEKATPAKQQESAVLRLGVSQLSRLLRRAGQSIVHAERLSKLLSDTEGWLTAWERSNQVMAARLRELDAMVNSQVLQLRDDQQHAQPEDTNFDPLELDRYDALHGLSRFIGEAARDSSAMVQQARESTAQSVAMLREEGYALKDQHRELLAARMVPVKTIIPRLKRTVAQTAIATQRKVALHVTGEDMVVDADVLSRLAEPLLHLLRNAVDHGIELPQDRLAAGKPELGTIYLAFQRDGKDMALRVSDDGRGLDLAAIEAKALSFGLIASTGSLSEAELQRLILQPGFSTRDSVTETSGRGVGMDIVNDRITGLKGRLEIDSSLGLGSTFTVHVPVSSGVAHALVVQCAGEAVALPLEQVDSIVAAGLAQFSLNDTANDSGVQLDYAGQTYPAFSLAQWLDLDDVSLDYTLQRAESWIIVLAKGATGPVALLVDAVLESRELILQDVGLLTRRVRGIVGGALRADGRPLFLLSVSELQRAVNAANNTAKHTNRGLNTASTTALRKRLQVERTRVLVVDDAWSVRRSMQQLLEDAGYDVAVAADGFEALERLRAKVPAVVLTDLEMPNLNGLELTRRMQEIPQWAAIPVVMITSRTSAKHRAEGLKAGVDVYLTKPYQDADLLAQVRSLTAPKSTTSVDISL
jgi:chemotaxis protein histidine kinase CheA/ActR/RegA family two-component response regulator